MDNKNIFLITWKRREKDALLQKRWFVPVGKPLLSRFPNRECQSGTKGVPFCPGSGNRDKRGPFVPVGNTNRDKRCCQRPHGWRTLLSRLVQLVLPTGTKDIFFYVFLFSILFLFQLYFCISIKLMYWNSVCMIFTNIYIYIYSYLYNICPR